MVNWKTFVVSLTPLIPYGLNYFGFWPASVPLPPLDGVWPALIGVFGVGYFAKDNDVTGGTRDQ